MTFHLVTMTHKIDLEVLIDVQPGEDIAERIHRIDVQDQIRLGRIQGVSSSMINSVELVKQEEI